MKEFNNTSNLNELFNLSFENLESLMKTNTIVGDPITVANNNVIIPISKASVGFVVGGGEYSDNSSRRVANHYPMAGGSGCGMSVSPVGFIVISDNDTKFVNIENKSAYQTILNAVNAVLDKLKGDSNEKNS